MKFDGRRWKPVEEAVVSEIVRQALIGLWDTEQARGPKTDTHRLQRISGLLSTNRIRAVTYVTKLCMTTEETFDAHPNLLNVGNGVVDLRDRSLRPHDAKLMLTKVTPVDYVPGATHPDWKQALAALPDDAEDWLQIRMGQGLTGYPVPDDGLLTLQGSGENGKSTIMDGTRGVSVTTR